MKDEGLTPTGTFKARGAAVGVSRAAELGVTGVGHADQRQRRLGLGRPTRRGPI